MSESLSILASHPGSERSRRLRPSYSDVVSVQVILKVPTGNYRLARHAFCRTSVKYEIICHLQMCTRAAFGGSKHTFPSVLLSRPASNRDCVKCGGSVIVTRRRTCFLAVLLTDACVTGSKHIELPRLVSRRRGKLANFLLASSCIIGSEARFVLCSTGHHRLAAINLS